MTKPAPAVPAATAEAEAQPVAGPQRQTALGRIRLRHLQSFLAVAQFGTLRRAAEALSITQPAVTKTINELEALLGSPLFVRGRHGAQLTADAVAFMRHASDSVDALGQAVDSVLRTADAVPLAIGVLPTVAPAFLPGVLQAYAEAAPRQGVRITTGRNAPLIEQLRSHALDAVIGRLSDPALMAGLSFESLYAEPMVIALRPGHRLAHSAASGALPSLAAVAACPLVLPPAGTLIRQVADGFFHRHGLRPDGGWIETLDTALARALLLRSDHLWFTPLGAVQPDLDAGTLLRLAPTLTPEEAVGLMLRTGPLVNPSLHHFVAAVRATAAARRQPAGATMDSAGR